ncbi:MAG: hypothetical protein ACI9LO_003229 [Planctomycetota bacterium]|jgi:hypothetical protein
MTDWFIPLSLLLLSGYAIVIYKRLVRDRERSYAGWSDISVQLKAGMILFLNWSMRLSNTPVTNNRP